MGSWGDKREGESGPGAGCCAGAILYQAPQPLGAVVPTSRMETGLRGHGATSPALPPRPWSLQPAASRLSR